MLELDLINGSPLSTDTFLVLPEEGAEETLQEEGTFPGSRAFPSGAVSGFLAVGWLPTEFQGHPTGDFQQASPAPQWVVSCQPALACSPFPLNQWSAATPPKFASQPLGGGGGARPNLFLSWLLCPSPRGGGCSLHLLCLYCL